MARIFTRINKGEALCAFPWESYNAICDVLENLAVANGEVSRGPGRRWVIRVNQDEAADGSLSDSGGTPFVYPAASEVEIAVDSERTTDRTGSSVAHNAAGDLQIYNFPTGATYVTPFLSNQYQFICRVKQGNQPPAINYIRYTDVLKGLGGLSATFKVIDDITYNTTTHKLEYTYALLTFTDGLLTSRISEVTPTLIDQTVEETY